jgi:hypothetical protein
LPGKLPALEPRFRDTTSKLLAKHGLNVIGYWVPEGSPAWDNTFVDILAYRSRDEAKKNWEAFVADPEFQRTSGDPCMPILYAGEVVSQLLLRKNQTVEESR